MPYLYINAPCSRPLASRLNAQLTLSLLTKRKKYKYSEILGPFINLFPSASAIQALVSFMNLDILVEQISLLVKRRKQTSKTAGKFACRAHERRRLYYES